MDSKLEKKIINHYILKGITKSLLISIIIGFSFAILFSLFNMFYIKLSPLKVIFLIFLITLLLIPILYFSKFRKSKKKIIKELDSLGLKERLITLYEVKETPKNKEILGLLKEDTEKEVIKLLSRKDIKKLYKKEVLLYALFFFILGLATIMLYVFSYNKNHLNSKSNIYYNIYYKPSSGGIIKGDIYQIISEKGNANEVIAISDNGYIFDKWSDGVLSNKRKDLDIKNDLTITANFIKLDENLKIDLKEYEKEIADMSNLDLIPKMPSSGGAAGRFKETNQVINGKIYYRDVLDKFYENEFENISESNIPVEIIEYIRKYYKVIK